MSNGWRYTIFTLWVILVATASAMAQERIALTDSLQMEIHFRWDRSELDTTYMGNGRTLAEMRTRIDSLGTARIDSVVILSQSSPEGSYQHNQRLSTRRAATMRHYMVENYPELENRLTVNPDGESWDQLREWVVRDTRIKESSRERVLKILDDNSVSIDTKKWRIAHDPLYRYLLMTYYPRIRNSMICILYFSREEEPALNLPLEYEMARARTFEMQPAEATYTPKRDTLTFALKSNLLYDLGTVLNVEAEVPIGRHWSIAAEYLFPWWEKDNKHCLQMLELGVEGRYWFRNNIYHRNKLEGHFLGLYAMSSKYDIQNDYDLCYQGEYWSTGLTYGYAMPIGKRKRVQMEFSISVGYLSSAYRHYQPADDYSELWRDKYKTGRVGYFGPTKLKVSLVVPIHIPYNKKGGRR